MTEKQTEWMLSCYFVIRTALKHQNDVYLCALNESPRSEFQPTKEQEETEKALVAGFRSLNHWKNVDQYYARLPELRTELKRKGKLSRETDAFPRIPGVPMGAQAAFWNVSLNIQQVTDAARPNGWRVIETKLTPFLHRRYQRNDAGVVIAVIEEPVIPSIYQAGRTLNYSGKSGLHEAYWNAIRRVRKVFTENPNAFF